MGVLRGFLPWVPGGTRTHDIQNHNLKAENLVNPFVYNRSVVCRFLLFRKFFGNKCYLFVFDMRCVTMKIFKISLASSTMSP